MVAIKEVKTVGAPSYTSGVQKWKGAADTLNAIENSNRSIPAIKRAEGLSPSIKLMPEVVKEPTAP